MAYTFQALNQHLNEGYERIISKTIIDSDKDYFYKMKNLLDIKKARVESVIAMYNGPNGDEICLKAINDFLDDLAISMSNYTNNKISNTVSQDHEKRLRLLEQNLDQRIEEIVLRVLKKLAK